MIAVLLGDLHHSVHADGLNDGLERCDGVDHLLSRDRKCVAACDSARKRFEFGPQRIDWRKAEPFRFGAGSTQHEFVFAQRFGRTVPPEHMHAPVILASPSPSRAYP